MQDTNNDNMQQDLFSSGNTHIPKKTESSSAQMFCDGASSGNPGKSGIGIFICLDDEGISGRERSFRLSEYIGIATNNVAEYTALIRGMEKSLSLGVNNIDIYLDSELLVKQMNGTYRVKNKNLIKLWNRAKKLTGDFNRCTISHIRRDMNAEADSLARKGVKKGV